MSRIRLCISILLVCVVLSAAASVAVFAGDPDGTKTGTSADVVGATAGAPSADDLKTAQKSEPFAAKLADVVGQNKVGINLTWTLLAGFLVMFMQAGFALVGRDLHVPRMPRTRCS